MEPIYFIENRYSFVVDALPFIRNRQYSVDTPETAFERSIQVQLAEANSLLMHSKFRNALEKYLHIRALVGAVINPKITVADALNIDWARFSPVLMTDPMIDRSAEMLKRTSVVADAIPQAFRNGGQPLPDELAQAFAVYETVGVKDREVAFGLEFGQINTFVRERRYKEAQGLLRRLGDQTENRELQAAILHDLGILSEKLDQSEQADRLLQESAQLFASLERQDMQVEALNSLLTLQSIRGETDQAQQTRSTISQIELDNNLFPILQLTATSVFDANNRTGFTGGLTTIEPRVSPTTTVPGVILTRELRADPNMPASRGISFEELNVQPIQLLAPSVYSLQIEGKVFTALSSDLTPIAVSLNDNAAVNLGNFYQQLSTTNDVGLLMGYLNSYTTTVAYLTHVFNWVIPMAIGDCYAALGSYDKAEAEYLKTLQYPYVNKVVETVNVWIRLAELYVDWGDRLYRQAGNVIADFAFARQKYELVLRLDNTVDAASPLYNHALFTPLKTRAETVINNLFVQGVAAGDNPKIALPLMRARIQLVKIANELNFIGIGVHIPPFSFEYLQNLARYFAQHAAQTEQRYIQFKSTGENEELREDQMAQQVDLAAASVELERRGVAEAEEGVDVATANRNYAQVQVDNATNAAALFDQNRAKLAEVESLLAWSTAAAQDQDDEVTQIISGYSYYSTGGRRRSLVVQDLTRMRTQISHDLEAARLQREINSANAYKAVANEQIQQAQARVAVAEQRVAIAAMQEQHARENLDFLAGREFSSHMWYNLAREARRIAQTYLDRAIEVATLMEKAYEAETGRDLRKIKFDYGLDHLNGLLSADRLLEDIDYFSLDFIRTKSKKAQMKQSISLSDQFPSAYFDLLHAGTMFFETTLEQFDRKYPGFYLQKVKQVELIFVGLNGTEGVHGTLRNIGVSQFRKKDGTIVNQVYPSDVMPLSEYNVRQDAIVFQLDSNQLRLFENNGIATMWQLDLPLGTNTFSLNQILDIQLVLYYDGFFHPTLEAQVKAALPAGGQAVKGLGMRIFAPDELYFLRSQGEALLRIDDSMFAANQENLVLRNYRIQAVGEAATIDGLRLAVEFDTVGQSFTFLLDASGEADGTAVFPAPVNQPLFDTWTLRITAADNPQLVVNGELDLRGLHDVVVFVEYTFDYKS
jgi:hypothetical protein